MKSDVTYSKSKISKSRLINELNIKQMKKIMDDINNDI